MKFSKPILRPVSVCDRHIDSITLKIARHRLRGEVIASQLISADKGYQASIFSQQRLEQLPAGLEDPWSINKQDLP